MNNYSVYVSRLGDKSEKFTAGHRGCVGCGEALAVRQVVKALGKDVIVVNATGCMEIIASNYPNTSWEVPWIHTLFENASAVASGVEAGIKAMQRKGKYPADKRVKVVAIGGDGGTADIGLQALSGMLERGHDVLYVCFDNEAYMNTGIQRSGSTPYGATTTTSPAGSHSKGQHTWKKNMTEIVAAHRVPYVATANPAYHVDLEMKVKKAVAVHGPAYIHVYSSCPTGWRMTPDRAVSISRQATQTGIFPLFEVEDGEYTLTEDVKEVIPIDGYFKVQGRFRHLEPKDIKFIQKRVLEEYNRIRKKCGLKKATLIHIEE
ncbi:MAG: thiamine pyrophosphate-dependent enzyme [Pseudomonadota bacterium]